MRALFFLFLVHAATVILAPIHAETKDDEITNTLTIASNEFGAKLLEYSLKESPRANSSYAPFPLVSICLILSSGAEGETREELEKAVLGSYRDKLLGNDGRLLFLPKLGMINSSLFSNKHAALSKSYLYVDPILKTEQSFLDQLSPLKVRTNVMHISAQPTLVRKHINDQVAKDTNNRIKNFLSSPLHVHQSTRLILVNVLGFHGKWKVPFDNTVNSSFYPGKNIPPVKCKYFKEHNYKQHVETPEFHLIYKEYKNSPFVFIAVLPKLSIELKEFISKHKSLFINEDPSSCFSLINNHKDTSNSPDPEEQKVIVNLLLPEFTIETETMNLVPFFQHQGVKTAFDINKSQFPGITKASQFTLEYFLQKNVFLIDKSGTQAYSASEGGGNPFGGPPKPPIIKKVYFNRPFLYGLMDPKSGLFLFLGAVNDPTKN